MSWILLVFSLPTENKTARMRVWRALKATGAESLRDGVFVLPDAPNHRSAFSEIIADLRQNQGTAYLIEIAESADPDFRVLFDRSTEYQNLLDAITALRTTLSADKAPESMRLARKLRKEFMAILAIDFFPGESQAQVDSALRELELAAAWALNPEEPRSRDQAIELLAVADFQGRLWATRRRPWIDRLASAWLIKRFIDAQAQFLWLSSPSECPSDALGFDFDEARFTHVGQRVTFETLLACFELSGPALHRIGAIVHFLDVGGIEPPEAEGLEQILLGLSQSLGDDEFLSAACPLFDGLYTAFTSGKTNDR